ncbi:FAD/NAD(P)-binding protein [Polynucleobacter sp. IMCC 29146]|uniref:FAD/NAD(P)-binding protein n=1 Tax=Polynucleobacter sp. IMCC 29146 TaxID=2780953 RepID=UPI001F1AC4B7|nr:FAD/NAD(P)-binding protein [Polynucleobacter sp. IMCC 29146]MCE7530337.1 FAD/NAD(P)-binding protein [Polynucleobacter sp. IMCC 29146]
MHKSNEIVIVGDGFAAAIMVIHLLRKGVPASSITLIGPGEIGRGNAYSCASQSYRLNVREDLLITFSDDPLHFARWAQSHIHDPEAKTTAGYFYRRHDFGRYISELVSHELGLRQLKRIPTKVTQILRRGDDWTLSLSNQDQLIAKQLIIATGNAPPSWPCNVNTKLASPTWIHTHLVENPWAGEYLQEVGSHEDIILLGGGLTALDAINALVEQGHRGMLYVISPRKIFPPVQAPWQRQQEPKWPKQLSPRRFIRFMREYLPSVDAATSEWQCSWEELRVNLNTIWQQFSSKQRLILLKRVGWIWSLYRFRASPQTIASYEQLRAKNQIHFILGRAQLISCAEPNIKVLLDNGYEAVGERIINCTGVGVDPLLSNLITSQLAIPDDLQQSIAVDNNLRVLDSNQKAWENLWLIGPATMGSLGDVVAASAITKQAEQLAEQMKMRV